MYAKSCAMLLLIVAHLVEAAEPEPMRDRVCPDAWSIDNKAIPVIHQDPSSNKWPWGVAPSTDKADSRSYMLGADFIVTSDDPSLTMINPEDDLLTIASECLEFRNMVVDGSQYYPPSPPIERREAMGFIPASAF